MGVLSVTIFAATIAITTAAFRPPAVPLVVQDPYVSLWSAADNLTTSWTQFWDGSTTAMAAQILVDGKCFRLMGPPNSGLCATAATHEALVVNATRTAYTLRAGDAVRVTLSFRTPALLDDLAALPVAVPRNT